MNRPEENNEIGGSLEREIAEGEAWLGGYPDEGPSPLAVARVKQAVRAELAGSHRPSRRWGAWIGVAAAAAIVLAVVTSWPSGTPGELELAEAGPGGQVEPVAETVEIVSPWSSDDTTELNEISDAVSELETWASNTAGDWDVTSVYTAVEIAQDEMLDDDGVGDDVSLRFRMGLPGGEIVRNYDA